MEKRHGQRRPHPKTPDAALKVLEKGNRRYRRGKLKLRDYSPKGEDQASSQSPFAAIITCADSRLSPSLVFDIHLGNLFVSRIAGNSIDAGTLGSTEYAVGVLGVKLIMVLGHSDCGAIKAGIGVANGTASYPPDKYGAIGAFVDLLIPPIEGIPQADRSVARCTTENARYQRDVIAAKGPIIKPAIDGGKLKVVSAAYDIKSGRVRIV